MIHATTNYISFLNCLYRVWCLCQLLCDINWFILEYIINCIGKCMQILICLVKLFASIFAFTFYCFRVIFFSLPFWWIKMNYTQTNKGNMHLHKYCNEAVLFNNVEDAAENNAGKQRYGHRFFHPRSGGCPADWHRTPEARAANARGRRRRFHRAEPVVRRRTCTSQLAGLALGGDRLNKTCPSGGGCRWSVPLKTAVRRPSRRAIIKPIERASESTVPYRRTSIRRRSPDFPQLLQLSVTASTEAWPYPN